MLNISALNPNRAIKDFIVAFAVPSITPLNVYRGQQRAAVLPKSNDFVIFTPQHEQRLSKTEERLRLKSSEGTYSTFYECTYQIDFYGENARERAYCLANMVQTEAADKVVHKHGVRLIDVSNIRNLTGVLDDDQYTARYSLDLRVGYIVKAMLAEQYFVSVTPALIEVNANFKDKQR